MENSTCFICLIEFQKTSNKSVVTVRRGIDTLTKASNLKQDGKANMFLDCLNEFGGVKLHIECRRKYTMPSTLRQAIKEEKPVPQRPNRDRTFNITTDCVLCGKRTIARKFPRQQNTWRTLSTPECQQHLLKEADRRQDMWGKQLTARLLPISDIATANAKYHLQCYFQFYAKGKRNSEKKGRPKINEAAFESVCKYLEENEECQFSMQELLQLMGNDRFTQPWLKRRLKSQYGDNIVITGVPGKDCIVNFSGTVGKLLHDTWYADKINSESEERMRIVKTAAEIIREDIRKTIYDTKSYISPETELESQKTLPASLRYFLNILIDGKSQKSNNKTPKKAAIGEAIIANCRPRSFISPILLAVGVYIHLHSESKELVQKLHKLGFSVDYREVRRYEYSIMHSTITTDAAPSKEDNFRHFAFDNADFNVRTLTGHGTFHSMGGLRYLYTDEQLRHSAFPRCLNPPPSSSIAARGVMPVVWYQVPSKQGVKSLCFRELKLETDEFFRCRSRTDLLDTLCLAAHWCDVPKPLSWNGFMKSFHATAEFWPVGTYIEPLPFINLDPGNKSTIYTALKFAQSECIRNGQHTCMITFDQPLYAKALDIVASAPAADLKNVIIRLGGFHLLMSFLGSIGFIMGGSGLEELWSEVYAKGSVVHMLSGHAYARALRAHLLTEMVLTTLLLEKSDNISKIVEIIRSLYDSVRVKACTQDDIFECNDLQILHSILQQTKLDTASSNRTSKLWIQYMDQVELVRLFIRAERTGNWRLHLYCIRSMLPYFHAAGHFAYAKYAHLYVQDMEDLASKMPPAEYCKFVDEGLFTVRRKSTPWCGIWPDMAIEQDLMRLLKVKGGLTHGRGMSDASLAYFVSSFPVCVKLCSQLESLTGSMNTSSEQHVDLRTSRRHLDSTHFDRFKSWLEQHSPWDYYDTLCSVSSGVEATPTVNCDLAYEIGMDAVSSMRGCFGKIKLSRSNRVQPLSTVTSTVRLHSNIVPVNPQQLFMRLVWVIHAQGGDLAEYLQYELAPQPPSLFDDVSMRKTQKSALLQLFVNSPAPDFVTSASNRCIVVDGGYLLHALIWPRPATFQDIQIAYCQYVVRHFSSKAVVVFDGYGETHSTKNVEHLRRTFKKKAQTIAIELPNIVPVSQADFLCNAVNKSRLINILSLALKEEGITVLQSNGDADTEIVSTALKLNEQKNVTVISTDTDVCVMLIARAESNNSIEVVHPGTSTHAGKVYDIGGIRETLGVMKNHILLAHAITGCDTTSAIFGKGKKKIFKLLEGSEDLQAQSLKFGCQKEPKNSIIAAGEAIVMKLYSAERFETLDELRIKLYAHSLKRKAVTASFDLATLPPTSAACAQHSLRTYFQVQEWLGRKLNPVDWGWEEQDSGLMPIPSLNPPAPTSLMDLISCNCRECGPKCICRTSGLKCSLMCTKCGTFNCSNKKIEYMADEIDNPSDFEDELET